ncbi:Na+/H+ antiporter NhaA [Dyadobacter frigoris]|uniref:Na(+)/H(+) antiporter NhaA n=1 Tax=Dyadobacter frigoris TaxID=2576211 RepID=A0A4U6DBE5_9BACT|nr:Na+/H+ antiporter NhaA [Dyadobacter frigoris]TKT93791.1 Na+/H+ antiporter NhaA [Dyadobacter frigoris]GLU50995.1 Na(+)/H(+) antiporter NhaA [Dyadobacter frigoris]
MSDLKQGTLTRILINPIKDLADTGRLSGILLLIATAISLILANLSGGHDYLSFWHKEIHLGPLEKSIEHWVNDGLMVVFFFFVGLEIKREVLDGELASVQKALLPTVAAIGGVMMPAIIYFSLNRTGPSSHGWAIPTATDIAFSLGILSLLGDRVPFSLKVFLTALAVIDDLIAVLIIAVFYTSNIQTNMLLYAAGIVAVLSMLNYFKVEATIWYLLLGGILWYFVLKSGIHATIAGVLLAMTIPLHKIPKLEHALHKPVNYLIMPIFALANTAIILPNNIAGLLMSPLSFGVILGLTIGKPLGIVGLSWLAVKAKLAKLPQEISWKHMTGLGFTAGIGFTMSIFIASLSFKDIELQNSAKIAIIVGTSVSAIIGLIWLTQIGKVPAEEN